MTLLLSTTMFVKHKNNKTNCTFVSTISIIIKILLKKKQRRAFQRTNRTKSAWEKTEDIFQINLYIF